MSKGSHARPLPWLFVCLLLPAVLLSPRAAADSDEPDRYILVTGSGVVSASPDLARLSLGVETQGRTAAEARTRAAEALGAVLGRLRAGGVGEKDMQTAWVAVTPLRAPDGGRAIQGYRVVNRLSVSLRELDQVGRLLDEAIAAGGDAIRLQGIGFELENADAARQQARAAAVEDARTKAGSYARLTGLRLGGVLQLRELGTGAPPMLRSTVAGSARMGTATTPIQPGELDVRVDIEVRYGVE